MTITAASTGCLSCSPSLLGYPTQPTLAAEGGANSRITSSDLRHLISAWLSNRVVGGGPMLTDSHTHSHPRQPRGRLQ